MPDNQPDVSELTDRIAELEAENERLRESHQTRRRLLRGGVAAGALSLAAVVGSASEPQGEVSGTETDPLLAIEADRINFEPRTSDLSDADDGTMIWRNDVISPTIPDTEVYLHDDWGDERLQDREDSGTTSYDGEEGVYRPEWVIENGSPSADGETLVVEDDEQINTDESPEVAYGTWEFEIPDPFFSSSSSEHSGYNLIANSSTRRLGDANLQDGYLLQLQPTTIRLNVDDGGDTSTLIQDDDPPTSDLSVTVTRDDNDEWELIVNGESKGTATDSTHTTSERVGFWARSDGGSEWAEIKHY